MIETFKRYAFLDLRKGMAILLIVSGHIIPVVFPVFAKWVSVNMWKTKLDYPCFPSHYLYDSSTISVL